MVFNNNLGGEVFVPKLPSYKILDLVKAINQNCKVHFTGVRAGEKIFEELISRADSPNTYDLNYCYSLVDKVHVDTNNIYNKKNIKKLVNILSIIVPIIHIF